jgi:hypothetical protein
MHARPTAPQSPRDIAPTPDAKSCTAMNHAAASTVIMWSPEGLLLDRGRDQTSAAPAPPTPRKTLRRQTRPRKRPPTGYARAVSITVNRELSPSTRGLRVATLASVIFNLRVHGTKSVTTAGHSRAESDFRVGERSCGELLVVEKRDQDDDRYRHTEKPKQNSTAQSTLLMLRGANVDG